MVVTRTELRDVLIIEPRVFRDSRGFFFESFNQLSFREHTGIAVTFVQDNQSHSIANVLRGLHYQLKRPQGKLVRVVAGSILDVAVDLRRSSPTFGKSVSVIVSADNQRQVWVPAGFGHGFRVLSESADVFYKTTDYWVRDDERCVRWDDPTLAVDWGVAGMPLVSESDARGRLLSDAELFD